MLRVFVPLRVALYPKGGLDPEVFRNAPTRLKGRNENTSIQKSLCFDFSAVNYYHHSKETQQRGSEDRSQLYDYFLKY